MTYSPYRPNHFTDDVLGDPRSCTGDHNHPGDEPIPAPVMELAARARCSRCSTSIVDDPSMIGSMFVSSYSPQNDSRNRFTLCGRCGLLFREFIKPDLANDQTYLEAKQVLLELWG